MTERGGFSTGNAECLTCGHEWVAVWPLGADPLACPACNSTDTDRTAALPTDTQEAK